MAKTEQLATEPGVLVRGRFTLIGTMGTDDLPRALVMMRGGNVVQVGVGDNLGGARVDAISPDHLLMSRNGRSEVLQMPRG
jgi:type II secretory pathway component PulC